jgi:hypothetical protein
MNRLRTELEHIFRAHARACACVGLCFALLICAKSASAQDFATRAFVGQWNAQTSANTRIAIASAADLPALGARLAGIRFPSELLLREVSGAAFERFIAEWAGPQRCAGENTALCIDLIAISPYVLASAREVCDGNPCELGAAATEIVRAAMTQVVEDRVLEAKLNLLLDYRELVATIVPRFAEFDFIGELLEGRATDVKSVIQCADALTNCSAESVNALTGWLLDGLARSDDWRERARAILDQIEGNLPGIARRVADAQEAVQANILPLAPVHTVFRLRARDAAEFSLAVVPTVGVAGTEVEVLLLVRRSPNAADTCSAGTCLPLGLTCLNPQLQPGEDETFSIERADQAGLDCRRDAPKLRRTLASLGIPQPIAALAVPYDLVDGDDSKVQVRFNGSLRIGSLDLPINEDLVFPTASSADVGRLGERIVTSVNERLKAARPTLVLGAGEIALQDLCVATSSISCGDVKASSNALLVRGRLSIRIVDTTALVPFSTDLSPGTGEITFGELVPDIGPETLDPIVAAVREWFQVNEDASDAFRSAMTLGVAAYDRATQRVTIPVNFRVGDRQARANVQFSILGGLSAESFREQIAAGLTGIADAVKTDVQQRLQQLEDEVTDVAEDAACGQAQMLAANVTGIATVECDPFRVTFDEEIVLDGLKLVGNGSAIDHSHLNVYRRGAAPSFDADTVHQLVWRATGLDATVLRFGRPPRRTMDGIVLSPTVWIAPVGAAFDIGEVCIGFGGSCGERWADLRTSVDSAIRKAIVDQGNAWIQARGVAALGPVSNPRFEVADETILLKADVSWSDILTFEARAVVYPKFGGFEKPVPSLGPLFQTLLKSAGADWVTVSNVDPLELTLRLSVTDVLAPTSGNRPPPIELVVDRNGIKGSLLVPIKIPGSYGPIWILWANDSHIDVDLLNPLRFGFGTTLAFDQSSTLVAMPSTITVDLEQLAMRLKAELLIIGVALFEVQGGVRLDPPSMDLRARSTDVIRKVLDFDSQLSYDDPRLVSSGKLDIFGFKVSNFDLSILKDGSGAGSAKYGFLGTTFGLSVRTAPGLFPESIRAQQGIRVAGFDAKLGFDASIDSLLLELDSDLVDASVVLPSIKSVTPELIASLLLVRLDFDLQSLVNALRNVDDMRFAFSGSFGVGNPKHDAKNNGDGGRGRPAQAGGPAQPNGPRAQPLGPAWQARSHPQGQCAANDPSCYRLDPAFIYFAEHPSAFFDPAGRRVRPSDFFAVPIDKRNDRGTALELHTPLDCARNAPPAACWDRRPLVRQLGWLLDEMVGQAPPDCSLGDLACVFGRPGIPRLLEHPYLEPSARARLISVVLVDPDLIELDEHVDEPFFLQRMHIKATERSLPAMAIFKRDSLVTAYVPFAAEDYSQALSQHTALDAPVRATLERLFAASPGDQAQSLVVHGADHALGWTLFTPQQARRLILIDRDRPEKSVAWMFGPPPVEAAASESIARIMRRSIAEELLIADGGPAGTALVEKRAEQYRFTYFKGATTVCSRWLALDSLHAHLTAQRMTREPPLERDVNSLTRELVAANDALYSIAPYVALTRDGGGACPQQW